MRPKPARSGDADWRGVILSASLVIAVAVAAYLNTFSAPFLFDDDRAIVENPRIRRLWPPWQVLLGTPRPLVELSLAVNFAVGGLDVRGYHGANLAIHILAALVLFGLVRRTLLGDRLRGRYGHAATGLALAVALLWVAHPLQTQSVTYVIQRAESLMGLCYLLALYGVVRGTGSSHPRMWSCAAVLACALGMASKPVMVTAPIMTGLYDRVFLSPSWRAAWRERKRLYLGLAATWGLLIWFLREAPAWPNVGFGLKDITLLEYLLTQPGVLLHYVRLAVWPDSLVLDYGWQVAGTLKRILPSLLVIGAAGGATLWALRRRPALGFLGAWFFLLLAPTSSVIPLADLAMEHRMYLPLASVVVLGVLGGEGLLRRIVWSAHLRRRLATGLVIALVATFCVLTVRRNEAYQSKVRIWSDVVTKRPTNPRAHYNLGRLLTQEGRLEEAVAHYATALRLNPNFAEAHNNLGAAWAQQGRFEEAVAHYATALRLKPDFAEAHNSLGDALAKQGRFDEAERHVSEALRLNPSLAEAHYNLGRLLVEQGRLDEASAHYTEALRLKPDFAEAHNNLGDALAKQGRFDEAERHVSEALRLKPDYADADHNLQAILARKAQREGGRRIGTETR